MNPLAELLTPARTLCHAPGGSKKRLFETLSRTIIQDKPSLPNSEVFGQLVARERLGSTGLGEGIAIPHCRIGECKNPLGTLITLADGIDFDAPDGKPVDLLFALLVPEEADQEHLDILAAVVGLFNQPAFCEALRGAKDDATLHDIATNWSP